MSSESRTYRVLIGKPGLDGHDRGAKYVAHILREAGFEVIYTGIRKTPEQIVQTAVQEDVHAIGLSLLSGAHNALVQRVIDLLKSNDAKDILLFVGGTIPPPDIEYLKGLGVDAIFTPGTSAAEIITTIRNLLADPQCTA